MGAHSAFVLSFLPSAVPNPRPFIVLIYSTPGRSLQCNATETGKESICPVEDGQDGQDTMAAPPYKMTQQPAPDPLPLSNFSRAALVAASNTSSTPSPVKLEHSKYFRAPQI